MPAASAARMMALCSTLSKALARSKVAVKVDLKTVTAQLIHKYSAWMYINASTGILSYRERDDEGEQLVFPLLTHKCVWGVGLSARSGCIAYTASAPYSSTLSLSLLVRARERTSVQCELGTVLWFRQLPKPPAWIRRLATQGARRTRKTIPSLSRLSNSRPL